MRKTILSLILALTMLTTGILSPTAFLLPVAISVKAEGLLEKSVAENRNLVLYTDSASGEIAVKDKRNGHIWRSNPLDASKDTISNGVPKMSLSSQLVIGYLDKKSQEAQSTSLVSVVQKNNLKSREITDGIRFDYTFEKEGFVIPVAYTLNADGLRASILLNEIQTLGANTLTTIKLLPFFGAGNENNEGYLFVPDGSGAIINFNSNKKNVREYRSEVYGRDMALSKDMGTDLREEIRLPVFGIQNDGAAFLAVIEEGASKSSISASIRGISTGYNNVYSEVEYAALDTVRLLDQNFQAKAIKFQEKNTSAIPAYTVQYIFLEKPDYVGMAEQYRKYLVAEKGLTKKTTGGEMPLYLQLYGGVPVKKSFLGIPIDVVQPLTTFAQCEEIVTALHDQGVYNLNIRYDGWNSGGLNSKMPLNLSVEGKLGGRKRFQQMTEELASLGAMVFPNMDFLNIYRDGNGVSRFSDAVKTINGSPAYQYGYAINTKEKDRTVAPWSLLSPLRVEKTVDQFVNKNRVFQRISVNSLGKYNYSDFRNGGMPRSDAELQWEQSMKTLADSSDQLMGEAVNAYALPYVDFIRNVPVDCSHYDIEDYPIPFYQMVIHGMIPYSLPAVNLESDPQIMLLKALETGAGLNYAWIGAEPSVLKETAFDYLYGAGYKSWITSAVNDYKIVSSILSDVSDKAMTGHRRLAAHVYETTYENGVKIITNYSDQDYLGAGVKTMARNYSLVKGAE